MGGIAAYIASGADMLAVGSGLRYLAFVLLLIFAVGLYTFVGGRGRDGGTQGAWATVGLLGGLWIAAVGTVANSVETVGAWRAETLADQTYVKTLQILPQPARQAIFEYIEGWYNPHRRHSSLDYLSPATYEKRNQMIA